MHPSEFHMGRSKIDLYKWKGSDRPGQFRMIPKTSLGIDHSYQRPLVPARAKALARDWNSAACGTLLVSERSDGLLYVVEGQHRLNAALLRHDIALLPCMVHTFETYTEEVRAFHVANSMRRHLTAIEASKSLLEQGDDAMVLVAQLAASSGRVLERSGGPSTVACVKTMRVLAQRWPGELKRVWPLVTGICAGHPLHEKILCAFVYLECNLVGGRSLTEPDLAQAAHREGYSELMKRIQAMQAAFVRGGAKVWAKGVLQGLNRNRRSHNHARLPDDAAGDL